MDTSGLKPFAQTMRTTLLKGVTQRLRYWGFSGDDGPTAEPEAIEGGYIFRGDVHSDESVPKKWRALRNAVSRHGLDAVAEEAAYTWFNRLLAIRILEKNGYLTDTLGYAEGTRQPAVLYRARQGVIDVSSDDREEKVREALLESDDEAAFRELLVDVCHQNDLLNDVFGRLNDYTELLLPTGLLDREGPVEHLATTDAISDEDFEQVELIGWLYQFYISEKKDEVYDSSGKFQPEDIPAATQIFTPRWIVRYMVENTIGKQWLEKYPDSPLRDDMEYLVENDEESTGEGERGSVGGGEQMEVFDEEDDGNPKEPIFDDLSELELFDPAAGSGHILVVGFDLLVEMYRERGYTDREAVEQILTENLKGLEIDRRAAQLARFALLMKAAQYDRRALDRDDLRPEVYAMPEPRDFSTNDLRAYLGDDVFDTHGAEIKEALDLMAEHGQNVGSALKLDLSDGACEAAAHCVAEWDKKTQNGTVQLDEQALHQELRSYLKPIEVLTSTYPAVASNPPYLANQKLNDNLKDYLKSNYTKSKKNVFSVFLEAMLEQLSPHGILGSITLESWMFLKSFEELRNHILDTYQIRGVAHFGYGIIGIEFGTATVILRNELPDKNTKAEYSYLEEDDIDPHTNTPYRFPVKKNERYSIKRQKEFQMIPGAPIVYWLSGQALSHFEKSDTVSDLITLCEGMTTADNNRFLRMWSEVNFQSAEFNLESKTEARKSNNKWFPYEKGGPFRKWFGNQKFVVFWENDGELIRDFSRSYVRNDDYYFKRGLTWSNLSSGSIGFRYSPPGRLFASKGPKAFGVEHIWDLLPLLNSKVTSLYLEAISPTMDFKLGHVGAIPVVDGVHEQPARRVSRACYRMAREDWKSRELSWEFTQHPLVQQEAFSLKAAYNAWAKEATDDFLDLNANEEEINELFIDLYGLEGELSPQVALDDVTILEDELDRDALEELDDERDDLSDEELRQRFLKDDPDDALFKVEVPIRQFLSYGVGVMLGRYRLGHDGLHIAHPNPSSDELAPYEVPVPLSGSESNGTEQFEIDDDAIVPLMGRDSPFSDDAVHRMRDIVRLIWGEETLTENLNFINHALSVGRSRGLKRDYEKTMEDWLVDDFWDWHKSLYSVPYYGKKPIYWLFQSPEGHFQVLVYMHRMDKFTPQRVRQDYLQRHQQYLRREIESLESEGEETLSGDAAKRLDRLREAAADCREYDAILKDVADLQIEIDLDDGVQNNYPKFGDAVADL
jgi:hypothetical protein